MKIRWIILIIAATALVFPFLGKIREKRAFKAFEKSANIHFQNGRLDNAITGWETALRHFPGNTGILNKIGIAYIEKEMYNNAEYFFNKGLSIEPHNVEIHYNLSLLYFRQKRYDRSLKEVEEVIKNDYFYPNAHLLKGIIYEERGLMTQAQDEYVKEVNVNPGSVPGWGKLLSEPHK